LSKGGEGQRRSRVEGKELDDGELGRVLWRSRRGLLELDLRLVPFARDHYVTLGTVERAAYCRLLEEDDHDVLAWLSGREPAPPTLVEIVAIVAAHRG
jgi:antitoxin CptB